MMVVEAKMTDRWGPYGWRTLHSVAILYPDEPTLTDKAVMREWLENFRASIVCPHCKAHFGKMLQQFQRQFDIFKDRHSLFWFTAKAHNMVNARLGKPQLKLYREVYEQYARRDWRGDRAYYVSYVKRTINFEQGIDGFEVQRNIKGVQALDVTRIPEWTRRTDWGINAISRALEADPELVVDFQPRETQVIAGAGAAQAPSAPAPRSAGGLLGGILGGLRIPRVLLS